MSTSARSRLDGYELKDLKRLEQAERARVVANHQAKVETRARLHKLTAFTRQKAHEAKGAERQEWQRKAALVRDRYEGELRALDQAGHKAQNLLQAIDRAIGRKAALLGQGPQAALKKPRSPSPKQRR